MEQSIRNFCIISHIDHGKSTLADRFLELTGSIEKKKMRAQFLDMMDLEREKGITIKLQPVRLQYQDYILNLVDTPGHVDFSYEVSRSLAAVEGAVLLVDVLKGIQAQTLANLAIAKEQGLAIVPVINKIDLVSQESSAGLRLSQERTEEVAQEIAQLLNISQQEIIRISAKTGFNVERLLQTIIEKIPAPETKPNLPLRALIFDFQYDAYLGIIAYIRIRQGELEKGDELELINSASQAKAKEVGVFKPSRVEQAKLLSGEIGYVALGIKEADKVKIGDTITKFQEKDIQPLPGYKEPQPKVFMGVFPENPNNWHLLKQGLLKLKLNDPALSFKPEAKSALGRGFDCGFLGLLHAEIVIERLIREYGVNLKTSAPSVCYKIIDKIDKEKLVCSVADWPDSSLIKKTLEQVCELKIIVPTQYLGPAIELLKEKSPQIKPLGKDKNIVLCKMPFREIMENFYDKLKSATKGFGSMDYKIIGWQEADLVKVEILVAGRVEEAFSLIVPKDRAFEKAKAVLEKLKDVFPGQLFEVALQARVSGRIIARRTVPAKRKDVTAPLYGGDYSRKKKLLQKQRKGKKKLKERAQIKIPKNVFWQMLSS